ncbi:MAG: hypothetical protein LBQ15_09135 [Clostridium sp.]|jgi:hypothetical protein|nr:hypothetical protein [Clostridium sp.]
MDGYDADRIEYGVTEPRRLYFAGVRFLPGMDDAAVEGGADWTDGVAGSAIRVHFTQAAPEVTAGTVTGPFISFRYDKAADAVSEFRKEPYSYQDPETGATGEYVSDYTQEDALTAGRVFYDMMREFETYLAEEG